MDNLTKRFHEPQQLDSIVVRQADEQGLEYAFRNGHTYLETKKSGLKKRQVVCRGCKRRLLTFDVDPENPERIYNGHYNLYEDKEGRVTEGVLALRPRLDGTLGIQCSCGKDNRFDDDPKLDEVFDIKERRR